MEAVAGKPLKKSRGSLSLKAISRFYREIMRGFWRGATIYERYVMRAEKNLLIGKQPVLNRPEAVCAARMRDTL